MLEGLFRLEYVTEHMFIIRVLNEGDEGFGDAKFVGNTPFFQRNTDSKALCGYAKFVKKGFETRKGLD